MKKNILITLALSLHIGCAAHDKARILPQGPRTVVPLDQNWQFIREEVAGAEKPETDTAGWETVSVPHDWAIKGPFDKEIDRQVVRVTQDLEKIAKERTGRTGALPHIGVGWYRKTFTLPQFKQGKKALLVFDGAMSDAHVFVNGKEVTPVFVYTNYHSAELFVNGVSQGIQKKHSDTKQNRYRLMWMDVKYEPGTVKVVAFDDEGKAVAQREMYTAGKPHHLELSADRTEIVADGKDLCHVTVTAVDRNGTPCPTAANRLDFKVSGAGQFKAVCNGDATSLEMFHLPTMKVFSGKLVVLVQSLEQGGDIELEVTGDEVEAAKITIASR